MKCTSFQKKAAWVIGMTLIACTGVSYFMASAPAKLRGPPGVDPRVRDACDASGRCVVDAELLAVPVEMRPGWRLLQAHAKTHHADALSMEMNGEMVMVGGFEGDVANRVCDIYNPTTGVYRSCNSFTKDLKAGSMVYVEPHVYVLGGTYLTAPSKIAYRSVYVADMNAAHWESIPKPPQNFMAASCFPVEKKIYCFFGKLNNKPITYSAKVQVLDTQTLKWDDSLPAHSDSRGRAYAPSVMVGSKVYFFGGLTNPATGDGQVNLGDVSVFDTATGTWEEGKTHMPGRLFGGTALAVSDNSIFVVGGFFGREAGMGYRAVDIVWEYRIDSNDFVCHERMPYRAGGMTAMKAGNELVLLSGYQYGYRTIGYGVAYDLSTENLGECPMYEETDFVPDMEFPEFKIPANTDEMLPGGLFAGANPRLP